MVDKCAVKPLVMNPLCPFGPDQSRLGQSNEQITQGGRIQNVRVLNRRDRLGHQ